LSAIVKDFPSLWKNIEELLATQDGESSWLTGLLPLILDLTGLSWVFLTETIGHDPDHYNVLAECPKVPSLATRQAFDAGLAGLVHAKLNPLALPNLTGGDELSVIFHPGDPLKKATAFYGWPLVYDKTPLGTLLLVGTKGQTLNQGLLEFLECLVLRIAAKLQQEKLVGWIYELNELDPQTGLPHRSQFLARLHDQVETALAQKRDLILTIMGVSGLGRHAITHGQVSAVKLLRSLSNLLIQNRDVSWEIGHVSYGIFAISVPAKEEDNLDKATFLFKKRLIDVFGQSGFSYHQAKVICPRDGTKPEGLLETALTALAEVAS
jgi:GGDEF domain-containing protein